MLIHKPDDIQDEDLRKWFEDYENKALETGRASLKGRNTVNSLYSLRAIHTKEKKIQDPSEIEDEELRRWFDECRDSLKGKYFLYQLKIVKKKRESENLKNKGCLFAILLFLGAMLAGEIISSFDEKEEKPRYRINHVPSSSYGSGNCNFPSDTAIDGSRCGGRARHQ